MPADDVGGDDMVVKSARTAETVRTQSIFDYTTFDHPKPSGQLAMDGLGTKGQLVRDAAYKWVSKHPAEYRKMVRFASETAKESGGYVSMKYVAGYCRNVLHVGISDEIVAAVERIMVDQFPDLLGEAFDLRAARVDGYM